MLQADRTKYNNALLSIYDLRGTMIKTIISQPFWFRLGKTRLSENLTLYNTYIRYIVNYHNLENDMRLNEISIIANTCVYFNPY